MPLDMLSPSDMNFFSLSLVFARLASRKAAAGGQATCGGSRVVRIEAIEGRQEFEKLAEQFIDTAVAMTRGESTPNAKKTRRHPCGHSGGDRWLHRRLFEPAARRATLWGIGTEDARTALESGRAGARTDLANQLDVSFEALMHSAKDGRLRTPHEMTR